VKRLSDQTLYEIFEVSVEAAPEEIAKACDRAAATYGPGSLATYTLASAEETALLSSRIEEARAVLLDASARSRYDERIGVRPHDAPPPTPAPAPVLQLQTPQPQGPEGRADQAFTPPPWPAPEVEAVSAEARHISPGLPVPPALPQAAGAEPPPAGTARPPAASAPVVQPLPQPTPTPARREGPGSPPITDSPPAAGGAATPAPPVPIALTRAVAPILLEKEVAPPRPLLVPDGAAWSGEMLRRVRESRGLTVQQVAEQTRITRHHLENIEQDKFKALPAPVYLRGIIMSLARELRLDGQKVARSYLDRMGVGTDAEPKR
jgi:hypothetical protein